MKKILTKVLALSILVCSANQPTNAQTPNIHWQKCLGGSGDDFAQNIIKLADGNYLTCGFTNSTDGNFNATHGDYDAFLVKTNAAGHIIWKKTYGGSSFDALYNMLETSNGDIYAIGTTYSNDGQVSGKHGGAGDGDVWFTKVTSQGHLLSQHCYGGSGDEWAQGINRTSNNKIVFSGSTSSNDGDVSNNHGDYDGWVVELNTNGTIKFSVTVGSAGYDEFTRVAEINGKLLVAGTTSSVPFSDPNMEDYADANVAKLDHSGNIIYYRTYGGSGGDTGNAMVTTPDGNAVITGHIASTDGDGTGNTGYNVWMWKIDVANNGNIIWNSFLGIPNFNSTGFNIMASHDGGFVVVGAAGHEISPPYDTFDGYVIKTDAYGNRLWNIQFGGSQTDSFNGVVEENNGSLFAVGYTASDDGDIVGYHGGPGDALLVNIDGNGCHHNHRDANNSFGSDNFSLNSFPNPFSSSTTISFSLSQPEKVSVKIFDMAGRLVKILANTEMQAGRHQLEWNTANENINAGIYFLKIETKEYAETKNVVIVK